MIDEKQYCMCIIEGNATFRRPQKALPKCKYLLQTHRLDRRTGSIRDKLMSRVNWADSFVETLQVVHTVTYQNKKKYFRLGIKKNIRGKSLITLQKAATRVLASKKYPIQSNTFIFFFFKLTVAYD
jgi:hypothetical protein